MALLCPPAPGTRVPECVNRKRTTPLRHDTATVRVGRRFDRHERARVGASTRSSTVPGKRPLPLRLPRRLLPLRLPLPLPAPALLATVLAACQVFQPSAPAVTFRNQSTESVRVTWAGATAGAVVVEACGDVTAELAPGSYVLELRTIAGLGRLPLTVEATRPTIVGISAAGQVGLGRPPDNETCRNA